MATLFDPIHSGDLALANRIDQFLRSSSNHRTDAYGGSIENRARLLVEVMETIIGEISAGRTAIRISPVTPANDVVPRPVPTLVAHNDPLRL